MNLVMYDAIDISLIPADAMAVAGYTGGRWPTFVSLAARFPRALKLSIAVSASADADCLDVEPGDAVAGQAAGWVHRQLALGKARPALYASANNMAGVMAALTGAGISLASVRLWSAHYGAGEHICGPGTCGLVSRDMDGTQWTDSALGRNLDQSLLAPGFFPWYDVLMTQIPVIGLGSSGQPVKNWQALLLAHGYSLVLDGEFGLETEMLTKRFQMAKGLAQDSIVGEATWTVSLMS